MLKERLEKVMADKKKVAIGVLSTISVVSLFGNANYVTNIRKLEKDLDTKEKEIVELTTENKQLKVNDINLNNDINKFKSKIQELEDKVEEAKPWFEMKEEERKAEEQRIAEEKAEQERIAEEERLKEEAKKETHIGERIEFKQGSNLLAITIDSVYLSDYRNKFSDTPLVYLAAVEYTVENIGTSSVGVNLEYDANFYDIDGYKCEGYPGGDGVYNLDAGKKAKGLAHIAVNNETKYLQMEMGGVTYKWTLE